MNKYLDNIHRRWTIEEMKSISCDHQQLILDKINEYLESLVMEDRILWVISHFPQKIVLSSSFGIQSSVSLHLMNHYCPNIPVILIDTGYLFPETYRFIDLLTKSMQLNLCVFRSEQSPAWQEAKYGKLWEQGVEGIRQYNIINKINPMNNALKVLKVGTWCAGLRRNQSHSRKDLSFVTVYNNIFKFFPLVDWDDNEIDQYIKKYHLPNHPLREQGYLSVGDVHTSSKWKPGMKVEDTRFFGLQRECGLHFTD